jgi:dUTP pyrophosphatase
MLTRSRLKRLVNNKGLVTDFIDIDTQLQPHGFDLTVRDVHRLTGPGSIDFDNSERRLPDSSTLPWKDDWLHLEPGPYKVIFNEVLDIPTDIAAIGRTRSSLLRCGISVHTAVWDAGYRGRSEALLVVSNADGFDLKRDARILQLIFFELGGSIEPDEAYSGEYLDENL